MTDKEGRPLNYRSSVMRMLVASAHLRNTVLSKHIVKRQEDIQKALPLELGIDYPALVSECKKGRKRENWRRLLLLVALLIWVLNILSGGSLESLQTLIITLGLIEFLTELERRKYVRERIINNHIDNKEPLQELDGSNTSTDDCVKESTHIYVFGGYSPFVGAGVDIGGWTFTIDTTKKCKDGKPKKPLKAEDLHLEITEAIQHLKISSLTIEDNLVVSGEDLRSNADVLPNIFGRPLSLAPEATFKKYMGNKSEEVRHYNTVRVPMWNGQLIVSIYFRVVSIGEALFVEAHHLLLPPLKSKFCEIEGLAPTMTFSEFQELALRGVLKGLVSWVEALLWLGKVLRPNSPNPRLREIKRNPKFNYGYEQSIREMLSDTNYKRYFQYVDLNMYLKAIEQRMMDSIINSLELRNISTADIKERTETIVNNGMLITGGSIRAESIAGGSKAKVSGKRLDLRTNSKE